MTSRAALVSRAATPNVKTSPSSPAPLEEGEEEEEEEYDDWSLVPAPAEDEPLLFLVTISGV